ncbi:PRC-barrel domain protein [Paucimonas lemoignei]|uniref:PRC-barrel domain protein n=2 Tax=Paucimonas lemoignei TaxID=29443 RepID=A0A4R3HQL2_PAULE|nr:PRC-barrel domain protein [Paucimonas lemoignei]
MKRPLIITATTILCLLSGVATAQQDRPGGSGSSSSTTSGSTTSTSGSSGSGSSGSGASGAASGPVAGRAPLGVTVIEMEVVVRGWSAKKDLMDKTVMNDQKEKIGKIEDLIVGRSTDAKLPVASFAIIGVGGFLGIGKHDVAIPMEQLKLEGKQLVLPGATKAELKALPRFEYAR